MTRVSFLCRVSGLNCREGLKSSDTWRELRVVPLCFPFQKGGKFVGFGMWLCRLHRFGTDIWTNLHGWMNSSACIFNKLHTALFLVFISTFKKVWFSLKVFAPYYFFFPTKPLNETLYFRNCARQVSLQAVDKKATTAGRISSSCLPRRPFGAQLKIKKTSILQI